MHQHKMRLIQDVYPLFQVCSIARNWNHQGILGYFVWGFWGGEFFVLFSHIIKEVFFLFSTCVSSSVDTVHTRLADVFPYNLLVISIP